MSRTPLLNSEYYYILNDTITNITYSYSSKFNVLEHNVDVFFLLVMSIIIFLMQCGFAFLEAGSVRSKNTTNILIKNILDPCLAAFAYWICGWAFAYGTPSHPFIGYGGFAGSTVSDKEFHLWFFQYVFAATASTIVSGAVAERCDFTPYVIYCTFITGFLYPVVTHWAWADNGWLKNVGGDTGFTDFAGSGVVHLCGGVCAMMGAVFLGPRIGRFEKGDMEKQDIKGHSVPLAALGGFILMFGFFAFNGGSQGHISQPGDGEAIARAMLNTILSGALGALTVLSVGKVFHSKWRLLSTLNGALAGMVAICAGCDAMESWSGAVTGVIAGAVYLGFSALVSKMKVDDPLDAVAVHAGGGIWGLIAAPIFNRDHGIIFFFDEKSFLYLAWNLVGAFAIAVWSGLWCTVIFGTLRLLKVLRVNEEVETKGLDIVKHGEPAYPLISYGHGWGGDWDNVANFKNKAIRRSASEPRTSIAEPEQVYRRPLRFYENPELEWRNRHRGSLASQTAVFELAHQATHTSLNTARDGSVVHGVVQPSPNDSETGNHRVKRRHGPANGSLPPGTGRNGHPKTKNTAADTSSLTQYHHMLNGSVVYPVPVAGYPPQQGWGPEGYHGTREEHVYPLY